jgi:hypothetical protein
MERMVINLRDVNLENSELFSTYTEHKQETNAELGNLSVTRTYLPPEVKAEQQDVQRKLQLMPQQTLKNKSDTLLNAQKLPQKHNDLIEYMSQKNFGNYRNFQAQWTPIIWQAREENTQTKVSIGDKQMDTFDLDFMIAESLQQLYASEDPRAEYHDWIERQQKIEVDINTNGTTEEEVAERNAFIGFLDDRETEIKRIIFLYAGAAFNNHSRQQTEAREKLKFLTFKLSELRRLRERTVNTKDHADTKTYEEEQQSLEQQQRLRHMAEQGMDLALMTAAGATLANRSSNIEHGLLAGHVAQSTQTPQQRIQQARLNNNKLRSMMSALRNGMSKEEWEKQQDKQAVIQQPANGIKRLIGWKLRNYQDYTSDSDSY